MSILNSKKYFLLFKRRFLLISLLLLILLYMVLNIKNPFNTIQISSQNAHTDGNRTIINNRDSSEIKIAQNPVMNLALLDWSHVSPAVFSELESQLSPGVKHSGPTRILSDKKEYSLGDDIELFIRVDEPAGKYHVTLMVELVKNQNFHGFTLRDIIEGPFRFAETPNTLYFKVLLKTTKKPNTTSGNWTINVYRSFRRYGPKDTPTPIEGAHLECFTMPIRILRTFANSNQ